MGGEEIAGGGVGVGFGPLFEDFAAEIIGFAESVGIAVGEIGIGVVEGLVVLAGRRADSPASSVWRPWGLEAQAVKNTRAAVRNRGDLPVEIRIHASGRYIDAHADRTAAGPCSRDAEGDGGARRWGVVHVRATGVCGGGSWRIPGVSDPATARGTDAAQRAGFVASFYGTLLAGKGVVPINFLLGDREVAHVLKDSDVDLVLTIPQLAGKLAGATGVSVVDITQLSRPSGPMPEPTLPQKSADDVAVLMYTSGTSGLPKGVKLSYGNLQSDVDACIEHAQLQPKHRFLGVIPLFHAFGLTAMMLAPIQLGSPVVYMARFSPVGVLNAIRTHSISLMFAVPSMYAAIGHLKKATAEDFKSTYALFSGASPCAVVREGFCSVLGWSCLKDMG